MPCIYVYYFVLGVCLPLLSEGDYCPWDKELQSGLWLEKHLTDEEDVGKFKARNIQIQQLLQPVDPNTIPSLVRAQPDSEGDQDDPLASVLQHSQPSELTQPSSTGNPPRGAANRTQTQASTC
ncbi:hypothetical protein ILYODFUR_021398 [Ilyodon furcidens]|uniref:Uncharacterized protein n=1 Tax=Ilyodon furcidens TaxID=33524 RepID=A0ABV0VH01_9TELE